MKQRLPVNIDDLGLTPREVKFVCEYITNGYRAEDAAKTAGLLSRDAGSVASRLFCSKLLSADKVKEAIRRTQESFVEPYRDVHYAKIQEVLEVRAFYDPADFFNPDGSARPLDEIPAKLRYAIDNVKEQYFMAKNGANERVVTYELADRDKARKELRELHELKKETKDTQADATRKELMDIVAALSAGVVRGIAGRKGIPDTQGAEEVPATSASTLVQRIKKGEYVVPQSPSK